MGGTEHRVGRPSEQVSASPHRDLHALVRTLCLLQLERIPRQEPRKVIANPVNSRHPETISVAINSAR
jgi:hypothetical protein